METSYDKFKNDFGKGGCCVLLGILGLAALVFPVLWIPFTVLLAGVILAVIQKKKSVDK